ncbi:MAG: multicopper oxidase family protein [Anaerolineae bacterium]
MTAHLNRRRFLRLGALGGVVLACDGMLASCRMISEIAQGDGGKNANAAGPSEPKVQSAGEAEPDLEITLKATHAGVPLFSGTPTQVWRYEASVTRGSLESVQSLPENYVGPIIRVRKGQRLRITFVNDLPDPRHASIIHWHGLHLPEEMDAHPRYVVSPGQTYTYDFTVTDRAGTYWFHPHPDMLTGPQVYRGLAGLFIVTDDEEDQLALPSGAQDVPLVIQDRTFDSRNQLVYLGNGMGGMGGMMTRTMGFLGQQVLVNGRPDFVLDATTRAYRLRLLNGSNSRIYKLAWSDGTPLTVIGTDGGLLETPAQRRYVMLAPGERVELWADWSGRRVGDQIALESLGFEGAESGGMPGMMMGGGNAPPLGAPMSVLKVRLARQDQETLRLPEKLSSVNRHRLEDAVNRAAPRQFVLSLRGMQWLINGRTFKMNEAAEDEVVKLDTTEVWEFINARNPGQMMDSDGMAHPIHLHGVQFNVLERQVLPELQAGWDTVREGYVDEGWKDTVMLMTGERVKLLVRFTDFTGDFVYHCHNLEHEDGGMMRNYRVKA